MIDWEMIAPMAVAIVLILTVGGVAVLRPIAKRISELLELYARDKQSGLENDVGQVRDLLETMNARLQLMEERQDFTERLLAGDKKKEEIPRG
jgi:hypothetical protein